MSHEDLEKRIESLEQTQNHILDAQNHIIDCLNSLIEASKNKTGNIIELMIGIAGVGGIVYMCSAISKIMTTMNAN